MLLGYGLSFFDAGELCPVPVDRAPGEEVVPDKLSGVLVTRTEGRSEEFK